MCATLAMTSCKKYCEHIVSQGNIATFSQKDEIRLALGHIGERRLAEATTHDNLWGIGLSASIRAPLPLIPGTVTICWVRPERPPKTILRRHSTTPPDDPAPETPVPRDVTGDTVFEVDPITHLRLDTTSLPANAQTTALSAFTDSVPDDHAPEVLLAHEQRDDAPLMPEQGPDLIGGIVAMDDATFTTLLTLHSGVFATSRFDCRAILDSYLAAGLIQHSTSP